MPAVVADSSPLVYLARLGRLDLLRVLHGEVLVPAAVWREVALEGAHLPEGSALAAASMEGWIRVEHVDDSVVYPDPELQDLDDGEREAILLALGMKALLIIDEREGRRVALRLGLQLTGTLGLLAEARRRGLFPSLRLELDRLLSETNFRCAEALRLKALRDVGEL